MKNLELSIEKYKVFSGSVLKLIAIITMFIDHFALVFYRSSEIFSISLFQFSGENITLYFILRKIGRLAFPLFCFLVAEGFYHTKNQKKYILSLAIFALISEVPFNLMIARKLFFVGRQNVYFTLLFGALLLYILESKMNKAFKLLVAVFLMVLTVLARIDYGLKGVILIFLLYSFRNKRIYQIISSYPMLSGGVAAWFAMFLTIFYNGKRGFIKSKCLKYAFYVFYPLHITILVLIKYLIG